MKLQMLRGTMVSAGFRLCQKKGEEKGERGVELTSQVLGEGEVADVFEADESRDAGPVDIVNN